MRETSSSEKEKRSALLVAVVGSFLTPFMASSLNIAVKTIGSEFHADSVLLGWVATSYLLTAAVFLVPLSRVADIRGRKLIFTAGLFVYTIGSLLCGMSISIQMFLLSRVVQGIGGAMIFGISIAILTSVFPPGERGKALGIAVASVYFAQAVGPAAGGFMTYYLGWRSIFFLNVPFGFLVCAFTWLTLKGEWAEARGQKFDVGGSVIYGAMLICIMYGFTIIGSSLAFGGTLVIFGIVLLIAFALYEKSCKSPVLDVSLFRGNKVFAYSNMAALINYGATAAVGFLLALYLQNVKGLPANQAGLVMISQPLVQAIFSPIAGKLSDRVEPRIVASCGMGLTAIGLGVFCTLTANSGIPTVIVGLLLLGFGFGLFSSPNTNAIMSSVSKKHYGVASGMVSTMRLIGMTLSMGIATMLFSVYIGQVEITSAVSTQFVTAMRLGFLIFAILCTVGIFASLARGKLREGLASSDKV
jgi:EmrB/QacA subfamily drug resistance transporter